MKFTRGTYFIAANFLDEVSSAGTFKIQRALVKWA